MNKFANRVTYHMNFFMISNSIKHIIVLFLTMVKGKEPHSVMNDHEIAHRKLPSEAQAWVTLFMKNQQLPMYTGLPSPCY